MGLDGLVIYKYRLYGKGHGVAEYGSGGKSFLHEPIGGELKEGGLDPGSREP